MKNVWIKEKTSKKLDQIHALCNYNCARCMSAFSNPVIEAYLFDMSPQVTLGGSFCLKSTLIHNKKTVLEYSNSIWTTSATIQNKIMNYFANFSVVDARKSFAKSKYSFGVS